jgi:hypothetical protein
LTGVYQFVGTDDTKGVIREADGAIIPPDPYNSDWETFQAWLASGNTPDPAPTPPPPTVISKLALWSRFTPDEQAAIVGAAQTNVTVGVWLQTALVQESIDLSNPLTKEGLDALVAAGVLTSDRETAILTP